MERSFEVTAPTQQAQSIVFSAIGDKNVEDEPFTISAIASSGLPVSFEIVSGPATLSGNTVTLDGVGGTVTIRATQAGNASYLPATPVERSFEVRLLNQAINMGQLDNKLTTDAPFGISATATSGLPVSFEIVSGPATISGTTITLDGVPGTVVVRATQAGNNQYNAATPVERDFIVGEAVLEDQTISFAALNNKTVFANPFDVSATASSGLPVSFEIVSGPATISNNTVTLNAIAGTVVVRATQNGDANFNPAPPVERSFEVIRVNQEIDFAPLADKIVT
ncbi:MAG: hypothetical protein AAFO94_22235, partial [Bacteroidota bacterium]